MKKCWFVAGRRRKGKEEREKGKVTDRQERKEYKIYEEMLVCCWEKEKGERRKRKGKERKRKSRWCLGLVSDTGPTKMHVFTLLPPSLVFQKLKTIESCFQFP